MAFNTVLKGYVTYNDATHGIIYNRAHNYISTTSSDFANSGFKYVVLITFSGGDTRKFLISPNAVGSCVFDTYGALNEMFAPNPYLPDGTHIWKITDVVNSTNMNCDTITIDVYQGWTVGGVFTEDETVKVTYDLMVIDGELSFPFYSGLVLPLHDTGKQAVNFILGSVKQGLALPTEIDAMVWQNVGVYQADVGYYQPMFKIMTWLSDNGSYSALSQNFDNIYGFKFDLYSETGSLITSVTIPSEPTAGSLAHVPVGLVNLRLGGHITFGQMGNTKYWTVTPVDDAGDIVGRTYGFVQVNECKYNPIHLFWKNNLGGFDSYSFQKKSEPQTSVERKRIQKNGVDYNNATYTDFATPQTGNRFIEDRTPIVTESILITSDWLTEQEFTTLKGIVTSNAVEMYDNNGVSYAVEPVVVEDTTYIEKRERNFKKYNLTLRIRKANDFKTPY